MNFLKHFTALGVSLVFIGAVTPVQATSTDVVLNLEGNPTCSSLGDNSLVQVLKDSNPGGIRELTLPLPNGGGTQKLIYTVEPIEGIDQITTWDIVEVNGNRLDRLTPGPTEVEDFYAQVNAINYVILKAQGGNNGARVFHYGTSEDGPGAAGAITDDLLVSPGPILTAVSFCYGLTTGFDEPSPPIVLSDIPNCEELTNSELYTTGITCPTEGPIPGSDPEEQLIINMSLNDPRFGFDVTTDTIRACTCNSQLKPCNPALPAQRVNDLGQYLDELGMPILDEAGNPITADDLSQEDRTCLEYNPLSTNDRGTPDGVNDRVPFHIEGVENPDSYICYTIDGVRTCYGHY
jgi:hypothetical protein